MKRPKIFRFTLLAMLLVVAFSGGAVAANPTVLSVSAVGGGTASKPIEVGMPSDRATKYRAEVQIAGSILTQNNFDTYFSADVVGDNVTASVDNFAVCVQGPNTNKSMVTVPGTFDPDEGLIKFSKGSLSASCNIIIDVSFDLNVGGSGTYQVAALASPKSTDVSKKSTNIYYTFSVEKPTVTPTNASWTGKATEPWSRDVVAKNAYSTDVTIPDATVTTLWETYGIRTLISDEVDGSVVVRFETSKDATVNPDGVILRSTPTNGVKIAVTATNSKGTAKGNYTFATKNDKLPTAKDAFWFNGEAYLFHDGTIEPGTLVSADYLAEGVSVVNTSIDLSPDVALPITWKVTGLPTGLTGAVSTDPRLFEITGTPTKSGTFKYKLEVTNSVLKQGATIERTVTVEPLFTSYDNYVQVLNNLTTGKDYKASVKLPGATSWDISFDVDALAMATDDDGDLDTKLLPLTATYDKNKGELSINGKAANLNMYPASGSYDVIFRVSNDVTSDDAEIHYQIPVVAVAPKLTTKTITASLSTPLTAKTGKIEATGTFPISFDFDIADADLAKIFVLESSPDAADNIENLTGAEKIAEILGLTLVAEDFDNGESTTSDDGYITLAGTAKYALKDFPVTVKMYNPYTAQNGGDPVETVVKITARGSAPKFPTAAPKDPLVIAAGASEEQIADFMTKNAKYFSATGSAWMGFSAPGLPEGMSLSSDIGEEDPTTFGTTDNPWVAGITGTVPNTPETKFTINLTAQNVEGKATQKIPVIIKKAVDPSDFDSPIVLKTATHGSDYTATYKLEGVSYVSKDAVDPSDGPFTVAWDSAKSTITVKATKNDFGKAAYPEGGSFDLTIMASNDLNAGPEALVFRIPDNPVKAKLETKELSTTVTTGFTTSTGQIKASGTTPISFDFALDEDAYNAVSLDPSITTSDPLVCLSSLGLSVDIDMAKGIATITSSPDIRAALSKFPVTVKLLGPGEENYVEGQVKITVKGTGASFVNKAPTTAFMAKAGGGEDDIMALNELVSASLKVYGTEPLNVTLTGAPSGWFISKDPQIASGLNKITPLVISGDSIPSDVTKYNITVNVSNADGKASQKLVVQTASALTPPQDQPIVLTKSLEFTTTGNKAYSATYKFDGAKYLGDYGAFSGDIPSDGNYVFAGKPARDKAAGTDELDATHTNKSFKVELDPTKQTLTFSAAANAIKEYPAWSGGSYDIEVLMSNDIPGIALVHFRVPIKLEKPKLTAPKELKFTEGKVSTQKLEASGTRPISFDFDIDATELAKIFSDIGSSTTANEKFTKYLSIDLMANATEIKAAEAAGTYTLGGTSTPKVVVKNLPVTVKMYNDATRNDGGDPVTTTIKLTIEGTAPKFKKSAPKDAFIVATGASDLTKLQNAMAQYLSFDASPTVTFDATGLPSGVEVIKSDDGSPMLSGTFPETVGKYNISFKVTNSLGNASQKLTVQTAAPVTAPENPFEMKVLELGKDYNQSYKFTNGATEVSEPDTAVRLPSDYTNIGGFKVAYDKTKNTITVTASKTNVATYPEGGSFDIEILMSNDVNDGPVTGHLRIPVKAIAPKLATKELSAKLTAGFNQAKIEITGTLPISVDFGIDAEAFAKLLPDSEATDSSDMLSALGLTFNPTPDEGGALLENVNYITVTSTPSTAVAFKKFPITIAMENPGGTATAKLPITLEGSAPKFVASPKNGTVYTVKAGESDYSALNEIISNCLQVSGTKPLTVTLSGTVPSGMTVTQDEITDSTNTQLVLGVADGSSVPNEEKKYIVTVNVQNSEGKASQKLTIETAQSLPDKYTDIDKPYKTLKVLEIGKPYSVSDKFAGATYASQDVIEDSTIETPIKVTLDATKNTLTFANSKTISSYPTDEDGVFIPNASYDVLVQLSNDIEGILPVYYRIPIKANPPKLETKEITGKYGTPFTKTTTVKATGTTPISMDFIVDSDKFKAAFPESTAATNEDMLKYLGLNFSNDMAKGITEVSTDLETDASMVTMKKFPITVNLLGPGGSSSGTVNFTITGTAPELSTTTGTYMVKAGGDQDDLDALNELVSASLRVVKGTKPFTATMSGLEGLKLSEDALPDGTTAYQAQYVFAFDGVSAITDTEKNNNVAITVTNSEGKASKKLTIATAKALDTVITSETVPYATLKALELGKAYEQTTKLAAKEAKLVLVNAGGATNTVSAKKPARDKGTEHSETNYNNSDNTSPFTIKLDATKGILTVKATKIDTYPVSSDASFDVLVHASNDIPGVADVHIRIPIKTEKPALTTKELSLAEGQEISGTKATIAANGTKPISFDFEIADADFFKVFPASKDETLTTAQKFAALGLEFDTDADTNSAAGKYAFGGTPTVVLSKFPVTAKMYNANTGFGEGATPINGKFTISVSGTAPKFDKDASKLTTTFLVATNADSDNGLDSLNTALADYLKFTGSPQMTVTPTGVPDNLKLVINNDGNALEFTGTAPDTVNKYKITATITNSLGKAVQKFTLETGEAVPEPTEAFELKQLEPGKDYSATLKFTNGAKNVVREGTVEPSDYAEGGIDGAFSLKYDPAKTTLTVTAKGSTLKYYPATGGGSFDIPIKMSNDLNSGDIDGHLRIPVKATAPKLTTKSIEGTAGAAIGNKGLIEASGTTPISFDLDIDLADLITIFAPISTDAATNLVEANFPGIVEKLEFLGLEVQQDEARPTESGYAIGNNKITISGTPTYALSKLPVKVKLYNPVTGYDANAEPVETTIQMNIKGVAPVFSNTRVPAAGFKVITSATAEQLNALSADMAPYLLLSKGTQPLTLTATGLPDGMMISLDETDDTLLTYTLVGETTPETGKKYSVVVTAQNAAGKATQKIALEVMDPVVLPKEKLELGPATYDKAFSGTPTLEKGSKPVYWFFAGDENAPEAGTFPRGYETAEDLAGFGLAIDSTKGSIKATKITQYSPDITFYIIASNEVSVASQEVTLSIGLAKPKFSSAPKLPEGTKNAAYQDSSKKNPTITAEGFCPTFLISVNDGNFVSDDVFTDTDAILPGLELAVTEDDDDYDDINKGGTPTDGYFTKNTLTISGTPTDITSEDNAVKAISLTVRIIGPNYDPNSDSTYTDKTFSLLVRDQAPKFKTSTFDLGTLVSMDDEMSVTMNLIAGTGDYKWTVTGAGAGMEVSFDTSGVIASTSDGYSVTVKASDQPKLNIATTGTKKANGSLKVTVENIRDSKLKTSATLNFKIGATAAHKTPDFGSAPSDSSAKPELDISEKPELEAEVEETTEAVAEETTSDDVEELDGVTMGAERSAESLTDEEKAALSDYVIAAVLPELSVVQDGQYDFEVDLDENVIAGAHLEWFAFPRTAAATEDDEIVDFATSKGEPTEVIPSDHFVIVSPWLTANVTYAPVIAVKAEEVAKLEAEKAAAEAENPAEESETEEEEKAESEEETQEEAESESEVESETEAEVETESETEPEVSEPAPEPATEVVAETAPETAE